MPGVDKTIVNAFRGFWQGDPWEDAGYVAMQREMNEVEREIDAAYARMGHWKTDPAAAVASHPLRAEMTHAERQSQYRRKKPSGAAARRVAKALRDQSEE